MWKKSVSNRQGYRVLEGHHQIKPGHFLSKTWRHQPHLPFGLTSEKHVVTSLPFSDSKSTLLIFTQVKKPCFFLAKLPDSTGCSMWQKMDNNLWFSLVCWHSWTHSTVNFSCFPYRATTGDQPPHSQLFICSVDNTRLLRDIIRWECSHQIALLVTGIIHSTKCLVFKHESMNSEPAATWKPCMPVWGYHPTSIEMEGRSPLFILVQMV